MELQVVLLVIQALVALTMIGAILIQRTAQDGGGLMGGGNTMGGLFTARGSANVLTRLTAILATIFILNSLALGYIASSQHQGKSILDQAVPATTAPAAPAANKPAEPAPTPAPAPAAPQVPMAK